MNKLLIFTLLFFFPVPTFAYLGPGMGGGFIAAIIGLIGAILLGLWGILYYPIKRAFKKRRDKITSLNKSGNDSE
tara:strand:- start:2184 stop:2408 length:225 start_codon:yes stop_codon:yes gene_type:complete